MLNVLKLLSLILELTLHHGRDAGYYQVRAVLVLGLPNYLQKQRHVNKGPCAFAYAPKSTFIGIFM